MSQFGGFHKRGGTNLISGSIGTTSNVTEQIRTGSSVGFNHLGKFV